MGLTCQERVWNNKNFLKDIYAIKEVYLFIGHVPGNENLYKDLQEYGYILIFKPTLMFRNHCNVKVKAIIVSGDGDFHCLIEYLEKRKNFRK